MATLEELEAFLNQPQGVDQQGTTQQPPVQTQEQPPVPQQEAPTGGFSPDVFSDITGESEQSPVETTNEEAGIVSVEGGLSLSDFSDITGEQVEPETQPAPPEPTPEELLGFSVPKELLNKEELTVDDIRDYPFEQIVAMADISSPLDYNAKEQLSNALRGSTTSGAGELLIGTPFSSDEVEALLEEKYQEFIERNPEQERSFLGRAGSSLMTGSPINNLISEESQTILPQGAAEVNALAQGATAGFGEDIYESLGMGRAARAIEASTQQLDENDIAGDATATELLGAILPASRVAKALKVGAQGVGLGGNIVRGAGAGATESALFGAGEADGTVGERIAEGLGDAPIGATVGAAGPLVARAGQALAQGVSGVFSRQIRQNNVARRSLERAVQRINDTSRGNINLTSEEIVDSLSHGVPIQQLLAEKGLRSNDIERVLNGLAAGSREMFNTIERTGRELVRTRVTQNADALNNVGQRLETARRNISPSKVNNVIKDAIDLDEGLVFEEEILLPTARQLVRSSRDTIARQAGYTRANASNAIVHLDRDTGKLFVVKPNEDGVPFRPDPETGEYVSDQLFEIEPSGTFITRLRSKTSQLLNPNVGSGSAPDQTFGFEDIDPIQQSLRSSERRASSEAGDLADLDRATRLEGQAVTQGSRGISSKDDFVSELQRETGELSDLPTDQRQSLEFIAEEMSALSGAGKQTGSDAILPQGLSRTVSDVRIAGMFSGSLAGFGRIWILRNMADIVRNALGNDTALSRSEEALEPVIETLMRADDAQVTNMIRGAIESGADTRQKLTRYFSTAFPAFVASMQNSPQEPEDALFNQLGAQ